MEEKVTMSELVNALYITEQRRLSRVEENNEEVLIESKNAKFKQVLVEKGHCIKK